MTTCTYCIYTYLDRQSCRYFFATFEFHITLFLFPWYNIYYDHCHLDISLSHSGYPSTNHHHRPATPAIFSVVQWYRWYSCWLPGWLPGWLACLLAGLLAWFARWLPCLLACLLAGWLACLLACSLAPFFACLLACSLAGLLACLLPCFPGTPVCENLAGKKKTGRGKKKSPKNKVPQSRHLASRLPELPLPPSFHAEESPIQTMCPGAFPSRNHALRTICPWIELTISQNCLNKFENTAGWMGVPDPYELHERSSGSSQRLGRSPAYVSVPPTRYL